MKTHLNRIYAVLFVIIFVLLGLMKNNTYAIASNDNINVSGTEVVNHMSTDIIMKQMHLTLRL